MKKKVLSTVLCAAMVAASLAGCGLKSPETATTAAATQAASEAAAGESKAAEGDAAASSDPAVTLVYAEVNPLDTIVGKTDSYFSFGSIGAPSARVPPL